MPLFVFEGDLMELSTLKELLTKRCLELGYELVSLSFERREGNLTLSLVVDRVETIDMSAIVELTNNINPYLDEINPIEEAYSLDISSLGAEKPLKVERLIDYVNSYIHLHLINPIKGENIYEGTLVSVSDSSIVLSYRIKTRSYEIEVLKDNISSVRLAIKF